jgi:hypothetical protein
MLLVVIPMKRLLLASLLLAPTLAFAGFGGDGFGSPGFFQFVTVAPPVANQMTTPVFELILPPTSGTLTSSLPGVGSSTQATGSATPTNRHIPIPIAGVISNLSANLNAAQNTSPTPASITANLNGVAGSNACQFTAASAPFLCSSTSTDTIAAGTLLQWTLSAGTGPWVQTASPPIQLSWLFTASAGQFGMILGGQGGSTSIGTTTVSYFGGFGSAPLAPILAATEVNGSSIMPSAFQAISLYVTPNATENATPHIYTLFQNGVATSLTCTAAPSAATGCCVNLTGAGTIGGSGGQACTVAAGAINVAAGDTLSWQGSCPNAATVPCAQVQPGVGVGIVPTVPNQAPITAQWDVATASVFFAAFQDNPNSSGTTPVNTQLVPPLGGKTLTFSNMVACTAVNPGGSTTRVVTSQLASTPLLTPSAVAGGSVATLSVANGVCPGAAGSSIPSPLLAGFQDNTHTWTASAGNVVINALTVTGSPAASVLWKTGMVAVIQ